MSLLIFLAMNLALMLGLFFVGVYQFMQIEEKRKGIAARRLAADVDMAAVAATRRAKGDEAAIRHLMNEADLDRFTAESALEAMDRPANRISARN